MTELSILIDYSPLHKLADGFCPDPKSSIAIVAKNGDELVGRVFLVAPTHIEGPWVKDELRGSTLGKRLMDRAENEAKNCGISTLFAYAVNPEIEDYLDRLGFRKEPMTVWKKDLCLL